MKKIYAFIALLLVAMLGNNLALSAQTVIAERIKVSDENQTYWYYIENGHNVTDIITDNDGRLGNFITGYPNEHASAQAIRSNDMRNSQRWKVVASDEPDYYYLINKGGNYLEYDPGDTNKQRYNANKTAPVNLENCKIKIMQFSPTTTGNYLKMTRKGSPANFYIGIYNPVGQSFVYESASTAATVQSNGLTANPRAWRFVPEAEMEAFYPTIYPARTANADIIEWYYIKSADKAIADGKNYLTIDPATNSFSLQEKSANPDNQLFGFVLRAFASEAYVTNIIARGNNKALSLSNDILSTGATAQDWTLRHLFSTNNPDQPMQATLRTARAISGKILTNELTKALPNFAKTYDTYDNKYTWVYEKIPASPLTVTSGEGITILTGAEGGTFEYGQSHTLTYQVAEGKLPVVKINNEIAAIGSLVDGVYTLSVVVTGTFAIDIQALAPESTVTFSVADGIAITSPTLDENNQCLSSSDLIVTFTLAKGYSNPQATAEKATVVEQPVPDADLYTFKLSEIQDGATINVAATTDEYAISTSANAGIVWTEAPADKASYVAPYTASFELAEGYHAPLATVNGKYIALTQENNTYTYTMNLVDAAKTVVVNAFKANELPVAEDLFVDSRQKDKVLGGGYGIQVQHSTGDYTRRSYLSFDASTMETTDFNKASLQMVVKRIDKPTNTTKTNIAAYSVTSTRPISEMTWNLNGEKNGNSILGSIVSPKVSWQGATVKANDLLTLNVTDHVLTGIRDNNGIVRMQVAATDNGDGYFEFFSREGAAAESTLDQQPMIVFERLPEVALTAGEGITLIKPATAGVTVVEVGESFELSFSIEGGFIPVVMVNNEDMTAELRQDNTTYTLSLNNISTDTTIDVSTDFMTSIDNVRSQSLHIETNGQQMTLSGAARQFVAIFSANGQPLRQLWVEDQTIVSLPKGLYLIKTDTETRKVQL